MLEKKILKYLMIITININLDLRNSCYNSLMIFIINIKKDDL